MDSSPMAETPGSRQRASDTPDTPGERPMTAAQLARLQAGEQVTFQALVRPLLAGLLSLGRRLTGDPHWAEDLVQETLIRGYQGIAGFRGDASLRTWMLRIEVRLAQRPERWRRRGPAASALDTTLPDHLAPAPDASTRERELAERLDEAMERLTPRQRTAMHLRAVEGLDYRSIAAILGGGAANARTLVLAARRRIMQRLGPHLEP
jgi:RNA polymerase sigma-70 factor (ECF subfamily)